MYVCLDIEVVQNVFLPNVILKVFVLNSAQPLAIVSALIKQYLFVFNDKLHSQSSINLGMKNVDI